ncbi:hypothetical protein SAMN05216559_3909 [Halomicrobium zhouii]|uniref:Uncharacterized protein n=1 Tax=Halomicrobium zhouii TaxID=767519 RepID=A0A1I6M7A6_9EURY|nr:hypothetical protein [Halomicrobium zhouii]SFS11625.1 hypothetical protein SAMN05216559_3909 [Halomicrobium zhouii]
MSREPTPPVEYGETWVYESIVGAIPGLDLSARAAVAVQFVLFEGAVLALAAVYDLWAAALAGTAAVLVAAAGSVAMLTIARLARRADAPQAYRQLLFGSSIEVVLGVVAFVALVTYLFVVDPRGPDAGLVTSLFGPEPPAPVVFLTLLILWDLCYRIGTGWWASVVALWRSLRYTVDPQESSAHRRADLATMAFGLLQLGLVPFVRDEWVLLVAVAGHVLAVVLVSALAILIADSSARNE